MTPVMNLADSLVNSSRWGPRWGWHDDHRDKDGTADYLPAVQQVRAEFEELAQALVPLYGGSCLQLGIGPCAASHFLWKLMFNRVVSVDLVLPAGCDFLTSGLRGSTHDVRTIDMARGSYDFLFIDAGHTFEDVKADHSIYSKMVRFGGIVAFHDALRRDKFGDGLKVWKFLAESNLPLILIGSEVGVAYYVQGERRRNDNR